MAKRRRISRVCSACGLSAAQAQQPLLARGRRRIRDNRPLHDALRGGQIPLHQHRRHRQHVADVVETVANVVGGKILGRIKVHADQIADRVPVLRPIQPPHRDPARVRLGISGSPLKNTANDSQESVSLVRRRLRFAFRGHAPGLDHSDHRFPAIPLLDHGRIVAELRQRQACLRLRIAVTVDAILLQERNPALHKSGHRPTSAASTADEIVAATSMAENDRDVAFAKLPRVPPWMFVRDHPYVLL